MGLKDAVAAVDRVESLLADGEQGQCRIHCRGSRPMQMSNSGKRARCLERAGDFGKDRITT